MTEISTHVLDVGRGLPAAGVDVELLAARGGEGGSAGGGDWVSLGRGRTDADGRIASLTRDRPGGASSGLHRLVFMVGPYQRATGAEAVFLEEAAVNFNVAGGERLHIPLLLSPYGYSIYRGS